ncbi:MAG: TonB-dependent receptor [Gammaproteobacteria bacterium]|nr:TonB-dependent receptor [Gammaproteobacteria bacterium]
MFNKILTTGASTIALAALALPASAQDFVIEEIVVTAAKRQQTLQEVPVAVSVTSADTIEKAQILDVQDLQSLIPSLRVTQLQTTGNTNFVIRGFGNGANNPGIEPSVGVFIDGVYRSRSAAALTDLPNLERIEVLRGPQSTLFGKNASAGVISVITAAPDTEEFSGSAEVALGNYDTVVVKADMTGPLSEKAAFSLSGTFNDREGYFDNLQDGTQINGRERYGVRGQLLLLPTDTLSFRFIGDYDKLDENCCGTTNIVNGPTGAAIIGLGGNLVPNSPFSRQTYLNFAAANDIENSGVSMQADLDFENSTLTSITAIRKQESINNSDVDFTGAALVNSTLATTDIDTFTQEFRLTSSGGEKADWMIGAFFFDEDVDFTNSILYGAAFRPYGDLLSGGAVTNIETALGLPAGTFLAANQGVIETTGQSNTAFSIFGTVDWYLSEKATVTFGLNYTKDEKDAFVSQANTDVWSSVDMVQVGLAQIFAALEAADPGNPVNLPTATALSTIPCTAQTGPACNPALALQPLQFLPPVVGYPNSVENGSSEDTDTTWTVRFAYDINDNHNFYVAAATGFKATSWNLSRDSKPFPTDLAAIQAAGLATPNLTTGTRFALPESSTVYEIGLKSRFDRGSMNITIFDQTIEDFQSNIFTGVGFSLANAGKQSTVGVEFDGSFYPTDSLQLTLAATWLDPTYDSFVGAQGPTGPVDLTGTTPAGIHELSVSTSATYTWDMDNGMRAYIRGDYLYEDEVQVVENIPASVASRDVSVLNASFGLETANGWEFAVYGRNLTDDDYLLSAFPTVAQTGSFNGYPSPPRTYGLKIKKYFD